MLIPLTKFQGKLKFKNNNRKQLSHASIQCEFEIYKRHISENRRGHKNTFVYNQEEMKEAGANRQSENARTHKPLVQDFKFQCLISKGYAALAKCILSCNPGD